MKHFLLQQKNQAGFTLVEALVAISILAMTIGALLNLTASGFFTIRYAKNDIVATNLAQESLEYIRNTRDTAAQKGISWRDWVDTNFDWNSCSNPGCMINPYANNGTNVIPLPCGKKDCEYMVYYPDSGFYAYGTNNAFGNSDGIKTTFNRAVEVKEINRDKPEAQLLVTVTISWLNGTHKKTVSQSIILTPWNMQ